MLAETGMLAAIATVLAAVGFMVKSMDSENETAFKAINFLSAIIFAVIFFLESAAIAMYAAILWAIVSIIFFFAVQRNESPLRGWNEELWQSSRQKPKRKRKPKEAATEASSAGSNNGESGGNTPIWPWG